MRDELTENKACDTGSADFNQLQGGKTWHSTEKYR